jgi:hypothetical protein
MRGVTQSVKTYLIQRTVVTDGCWLWSGEHNKTGYGVISGRGSGKAHYVMAHRAMWEEFMGPIPSGIIVCHHCDNPGCVNLDHLFLGSHRDNAWDCMMKGRSSVQKDGSIRKGRGLSVEEVRAAKAMLSDGVKQKDIAKSLGVGPNCINAIARGRTWSWLDQTPLTGN